MSAIESTRDLWSPTHYLRVEGINLSHFVFDTSDLSTIRGGGLVLLRGIHRRLPTGSGRPGNAPIPKVESVDEWLRNHPRLGETRVRAVSTGASSGLFAMQLEDASDAAGRSIADALRDEFLDVDGVLCQGSWVVDVVRATGDFGRDREALLALNRFRQMQEPSLVLPEWNSDDRVMPCIIDRLRPGTDSSYRSSDTDAGGTVRVPTGPPTALRRCFGVEQRRQFYQEEIQDVAKNGDPAETIDDRFSRDLEELAGPQYPAGTPESIQGKIAVLYFDGNEFGKTQAESFRTEADQARFDDSLKRFRRILLASMLRKMGGGDSPDAAWWSAKGKRRIETLLWGGDEVIWVVPSWKGWEILQDFYDASARWTIELPPKLVPTRAPSTPNFGEGPPRPWLLTHAGGIVFCHHQAPIQRVEALAKQLADDAKSRRKELLAAGPTPQEAGNLFGIEVLESFDHLGLDLAEARRRRAPASFESRDLRPWFLFPGKSAPAIRAAVRRIQTAGLPRGQVRELVERHLREHDPGQGVARILDLFRKRYPEALAGVTELHSAIAPPESLTSTRDELLDSKNFPAAWATWLHLDTWWDYLQT